MINNQEQNEGLVKRPRIPRSQIRWNLMARMFYSFLHDSIMKIFLLFYRDTSNGAETNNTSNGAASVSDGAQNSTKLLQSSQQSSSPITYNGAYVGVSEGFEKHAI